MAWLFGVVLFNATADEPSTCFGTTADGRLENGWQLPGSGENFQA